MSTVAPTQTPAPTATSLSFSRAYLREAKEKKLDYWRVEILAMLLAIGASITPWAVVAAVVGVLGVAAKVAGKLILSTAKRQFRMGERQRRYDFYMRTLGWPAPASDRADVSIANASTRIKESAAKLAPREIDYYAHQGPASTERLFCNLTESMFWSERLFGAMAKVRWKHFAISVGAVLAALVATVIVDPPEHRLLVLKYLGTVVALLVTLDVLGEAQSFGRGDKDVGKLLSALTTEMAKAAPSKDEALRLVVEYNCLLADMPLLPESIYDDNQNVLDEAWKVYETSLPFRCTATVNS